MNIDPTDEDEDIEINEAADLRAEDKAAEIDARFDEMDRKDQSGPHWTNRG